MRIVAISLESVTADELRWAPERRHELPHVECGPIGPRELAALGGILGNESAHELLATMHLAAGESQESPWVISIPAGLATKIATTTAEQRPFLSRQWLRSVEDSVQDPESQLEDLLGELQRFFAEVPGPFALLVF